MVEDSLSNFQYHEWDNRNADWLHRTVIGSVLIEHKSIFCPLTYFIQATIQVNDNFTTTMIINNFEFANVTLNTKADMSLWEKNYWGLPCFIITVRNLMMTFEHGRIMTWRLWRFSALLIDLSASARTFMCTMVDVAVDSSVLRHANLKQAIHFKMINRTRTTLLMLIESHQLSEESIWNIDWKERWILM